MVRNWIWPKPEEPIPEVVLGEDGEPIIDETIPEIPLEVVGWLPWFLSVAFYMMLGFLALLLLIYFKQESILYVPSAPLQYIE